MPQVNREKEGERGVMLRNMRTHERQRVSRVEITTKTKTKRKMSLDNICGTLWYIINTN